MPDSPQALQRQAVQLDRAGRPDEAIPVYQRLLALRPQWQDGWYNLGQAQWRARQFDAALLSYQHALNIGIKRPEEVHLNRGVILAQHLGRIDEAARELAQALALNSRYLPALLNLANLREQQGDPGRAGELYHQALALDPANALALSRLPNLQTLQDPADPLIGRLTQVLRQPGLAAVDQADLGFGLGKALNDVGRYDDAFAAYQAANQASRRAGGPALHYDAAAQEGFVDRLIERFATGSPAPASPAGRSAPIFICGMFRSGSTLVEQLLAAHARVTPGGELDLLPAIARSHLPPGQDWPALERPALLQSLADQYLDTVAQRFPGADLVTDKRPDNFLCIGLIKTLFPQARIVITRRDPLDNCLSLFFLHLSRTMPYALDLLDTAHWYRQHRRLVAHWQAVYGADVLELDYDLLVADPEPSARRLLDFCGLAWDPACLEFHRNRNVVQTASLWQVRQPLYRRSSGRWRHYAQHLAGLRAALGDTAGPV